jgi:hypothetical protein
MAGVWTCRFWAGRPLGMEAAQTAASLPLQTGGGLVMVGECKCSSDCLRLGDGAVCGPGLVGVDGWERARCAAVGGRDLPPASKLGCNAAVFVGSLAATRSVSSVAGC